MTSRPTALPDVDLAVAMAGELLRALTPAAGDPDEVDAVMLRGLDALDPSSFAAVCIAALRRAFGECMTPTGAAPNQLALTPPERTNP